MISAQWIGTFDPMIVLPVDLTRVTPMVCGQTAPAPRRPEPRYETYEPDTLVHVELEPAAESPFMDA